MAIFDEEKLLREHYEIMADIRTLKQAIADGRATKEELIEKIEVLEQLAAQNNLDHLQFVKTQEITEIRDIVRRLDGGTIIQSPQKAKENGTGFIALILRNPTYLMWLILGAVVITMVIMGYSFVEISQVLEQIR